jgi:hypothetical protein
MNKKCTKEDLQKITTPRNHTITSFENYVNVHSQIGVKCNTCGSDFTTSAHSYKNAKKTGCPCCKKQIVSDTHRGKATHEETKRKIGEKASQRPGSLTGKTGEQHPRYKGGSGRSFQNPSNDDYKWKSEVRKRCKYTCVVTLEKQKRNQKGYVCHHLYSWDLHEEKRYLPENGVFLKKEIHKKFHDTFAYGKNTETQFAAFCQQYYGFDWFERKEQLNL